MISLTDASGTNKAVIDDNNGDITFKVPAPPLISAGQPNSGFRCNGHALTFSTPIASSEMEKPIYALDANSNVVFSTIIPTRVILSSIPANFRFTLYREQQFYVAAWRHQQRGHCRNRPDWSNWRRQFGGDDQSAHGKRWHNDNCCTEYIQFRRYLAAGWITTSPSRQPAAGLLITPQSRNPANARPGSTLKGNTLTCAPSANGTINVTGDILGRLIPGGGRNEWSRNTDLMRRHGQHCNVPGSFTGRIHRHWQQWRLGVARWHSMAER